jgi:hypothetical protein
MEEKKMIINVPCDLNEKIYYIGNDKVEDGEFRGIQFYSGASQKEPTAYLSINHRKQKSNTRCEYPDGSVRYTSSEWIGSDLIQPNLSSFNEDWFLTEEEAIKALA